MVGVSAARLIDQADVRGVALVLTPSQRAVVPRPRPASGRDRRHPQISARDRAERPSRVAGAEQGHLGDARQPVSDVERLSARLGAIATSDNAPMVLSRCATRRIAGARR
jgi:hypothetical protein